MQIKENFKPIDILILILVLGSLWGLSEVIFSEFLKQTGIPFRTGILVGMGMYLMGMASGIYKKYFILVGIAFVAILCKQLVVPILQVSIMCKVNSCLAVLINGFTLTGAIFVFSRKLDENLKFKIFTGLIAGFSAAVVFYFAGMKLAPCPNLLSYSHLSGFVSYLFKKGLVWMVFSGVFFPVGYILGERLKNSVVSIRINKPVFYYGASVTLVVCCWFAIGFAISTGY